MRIAWVIYGSLEQHTGGYVYDRLVVEGLRRRGHTTDVFSIQPVGVSPSAELELAQRLLAGGYDAIVGDELCHADLARIFGWLREQRWRGVRSRLVLLVHHMTSWESGIELESERQVVAHSDVVITTSHTSAARLEPWYKGSVGARTCVCLPGANRLPRLPRVPTSALHPLRILFVGTWTERKGLLRALTYLSRIEAAEFLLEVVGDSTRDPGYAREVRQWLVAHPSVAGSVRMYGEVGDEELAAFYSRSDVLLSPTSFEGYGMALSEALSAGVPVVVSDAGATSEVVRQGLDGLVLPLQEDAWVHTLRLLISDRSPLERWAAEPRDLPVWEETLDSFLRCLDG